MGFSLLVQFGHIFERLSQISHLKVLVIPRVWQHETHSPSKEPCSTQRAGGEPEKIKKGVNFAWQLGQVCVCQNAAFPPLYPATLSVNMHPWWRKLPAAVTGHLHEVYSHPCQHGECGRKQLPRACLGFSPGKVSSLLIREAVITGRWYFRENRSCFLADKGWAQK